MYIHTQSLDIQQTSHFLQIESKHESLNNQMKKINCELLSCNFSRPKTLKFA